MTHVSTGPDQAVEQLVAWCHHGPAHDVAAVDVVGGTPAGLETFRIQ